MAIVRNALLAAVLACASQHARAQTFGTQDNFDCFNDTGETAEGFEMDIDGLKVSDLTRTFGDIYIRYGTPTVTAYDHTATGGTTGVAIRWAAQWDSGTQAWVTQNNTLGSGTPFVAKPNLTTGESCWTLGLGANYPASGCEHFGISLGPNAVQGHSSFHWLLPVAGNPGVLAPAPQAAALPTAPVTTYYGVALGAVDEAVEAPENEVDPNQYGDAYWVKIYTSVGPVAANLDDLQTGKVPTKSSGKTKVHVAWALVQNTPPGKKAEHIDIEHTERTGKTVQVTRRYEYYHYNGLYAADSHEAMCGGDGRCTKPLKLGLNGLKELGGYAGAHMEAFNFPL